MIGREAVVAVLRALNESGVEYMVTGCLATNLYTAPRSTKDADIVVRIEGAELNAALARLPEDMQFDPQMTFETTRYDLRVKGSPFRIELFFLTDDPHHVERFQRRAAGEVLGTTAWVPTPEDVVIQKIRWCHRANRPKDREDVTNVIADQHTTLAWSYIERWCQEHGTLDLLQEIRSKAILD